MDEGSKFERMDKENIDLVNEVNNEKNNDHITLPKLNRAISNHQWPHDLTPYL